MIVNMIRETLSTKVAVLTEKISNLIKENTDTHAEIIKKVDTLCDHVNHQQETYDKRLDTLEAIWLVSKAEAKTLKRVLIVIGGVIGLVSTILGILTYLGIL